MKAKRIVSILLTGSMLLSLLPVSALAAAPVFENRGLISSGTYSQPVHNSGIISGGTFQAGVNNSGNISGGQFNGSVANNSGTISGGTFQEKVHNSDTISNGTFLGNVDNWGTISNGTFQGEVYNHDTISGGTFQGNVNNDKTISDGTFQGNVNNNKTISDGTFKREVYNHGTISDGTFQGSVYNSKDISGGTFQKPVNNYGGTISGGTFEEVVEMNESPEGVTIEGGTFKKGIELNAHAFYPTIIDGLFDGKVSAAEGYSGTLSISGGLFTKDVDVSNITNLPNLQITGGYFVNEPTMPEGSDTRFTTVSDQNYRAFYVPVNDGFSENRYSSLYVPRGSSEQPNTITVKTNTKLLYYLADGEQFPAPDSDSDGYIYQIPVQSFEKIVLVTEEPSAPPTDNPDSELDPEFSSGAAALGIVLGTAGLGYVTYIYGSSLYLHYALPGGFIPSTRQELATVLWTTAGKPDPVSTALYTDIPSDNIEQQKAARWCAEQGLLSDHGETFGPDTKVTNARIIRAWNSLKKVPVPIK